jgi:hypothetical protein
MVGASGDAVAFRAASVTYLGWKLCHSCHRLVRTYECAAGTEMVVMERTSRSS